VKGQFAVKFAGWDLGSFMESNKAKKNKRLGFLTQSAPPQRGIEN
jgi:hypothetical protein